MTDTSPRVTPEELSRLAGETVVVTGAGGNIGSAFAAALGCIEGCRVLALDRAQLDVRDRARVLALASERPTLIAHCAGDMNADRCEREPEACRDVHVGGTEHIIALARATGARVFYPQSVFIFDGRELPVTEETVPNPLSEYGKAKLTAEAMLRDQLPNALIVRMAGFFGGDHRDKNFVGSFTRSLFAMVEAGERVCRVGARVWQPTYTRDLAENALLLLVRGCTGIYHMGAYGEATFLEVAQACIADLGLSDTITALPLPAAEADRLEVAPRPFRMVTANARLQAEGLDRQRSWREALHEYLARPHFQSRVAQLAPRL
jgi:dTDP-4-dehydrorhamnose reductase